MRRLIEHRYAVRQNLFSIVMIGLAMYFTYHMVMGERSLIRLLSLQNKIEVSSHEHHQLADNRKSLEDKVNRLRPGSLDLDLLEERVIYTLSYVHPDDHIIFIK
jgi:cell division protein FtsB